MVRALDEHVWTSTQPQDSDLRVTEIKYAREAHLSAGSHLNVDVGVGEHAPEVCEGGVDGDRVNLGVIPIEMRRRDDRRCSGGPRRPAECERLVDCDGPVVDARNDVAMQIDHQRADGSGLNPIKRLDNRRPALACGRTRRLDAQRRT